MEKGTIILLNGVSSSGKSTLAKRLTEALPDFFHLSLDDFDQLIERMEDREKGRLIPVPTELFFHETIVMFSDKGINVVADTVLHDRETLEHFQHTLADYPLFFVGVHCPAEELKRRERERGDRRIGLAMEQLKFVHRQREQYDLEINTYETSFSECAKKIVEFLGKQKPPGQEKLLTD